MVAYEMPLPSFYNPNRRDEMFYPSLTTLTLEAAKLQHPKSPVFVAPASAGRTKIVVLTIDPNVAFLNTFGGLSCWANTKDEINRAAEFFYKTAAITHKHVVTLDTHYLFGHLHSPHLWVDTSTGLPPGCPKDASQPWVPYAVTLQDYMSGKIQLAPDAAYLLYGDARHQPWLLNVVEYVLTETPKRRGGAPHMIWPPHSLFGTTDNAVNSQILQAIMWQQVLRRQPANIYCKGTELPERFCPWEPVVTNSKDGVSLAVEDSDQVAELYQADAIVLLGWCGSHCLRDAGLYMLRQASSNPSLTGRVYVLEDITAAVPGFEPARIEALEIFRQGGFNIVQSTSPLDQWPGVMPDVLNNVLAEQAEFKAKMAKL